MSLYADRKDGKQLKKYRMNLGDLILRKQLRCNIYELFNIECKYTKANLTRADINKSPSRALNLHNST